MNVMERVVVAMPVTEEHFSKSTTEFSLEFAQNVTMDRINNEESYLFAGLA